MADEIIRDVAALVEPPSLRDSVSYRIRLLQIAAYKSFEAKVEGFGSAPRYFGLLKIVEANPGIPQSRLAEAIFLDRSSLVPILDALSREGWIERRPSEQDRRVRLVLLAEGAGTRLGELELQVKAHEAAMAEGLSREDRAELLRLLGRLDENLRKEFGP
ncbi:MarR family winged helix-turn-helix transcriptional regulator [Maritimibacter dapengensis]|uniref:MarR family transcriptional regulator n=1 Tax=Maritimibacter dapengensis TaxID=2836868 RepID=A0ABS6T5L8_9RHOB|nr:MarR family transcriptional regulator [Maritimibacter dapengensis]MBV7380509.1 MarR family transcriptional regulator [Maritimibacter dapengensis]